MNVLVGIEDVTSKVQAAVKAGTSAADAAQAQRSAMSTIEKDCATSSGLRCDVVTFYSGEVYNLYKYKKYTDVRLVFAPEFDMAFFGGDPDNFTSRVMTWTSRSSASTRTTNQPTSTIT